MVMKSRKAKGQDKNLDVINKILIHLPLSYLFSKPELRQYSYERAFGSFTKLCRIKIRATYKDVWRTWKSYKPVVQKETVVVEESLEMKPQFTSEKKFGIMVIAALFTEIVKKLLKRKLLHWAKCYSSKYNPKAAGLAICAATEIQQWYRKIKRTRNKQFRLWANAVQVCLHRRKSMKYTIRFELLRRQAAEKLKNGVAYRRRYFFAVRVIQRHYRWLLLYRKTKYRLIRVINARKIQRFHRMFSFRTPFEKSIIMLVIRCGGHSVVFNKLPKSYIEQYGKLRGIDQIVSVMQKAWMKACGKLALFERFAQRKKELAYLQMLNDNATIIQNSYRAHLWDRLMLAAIHNNRARRIQRAFRSSFYRYWVTKRLILRRERFARRIQKIMRHRFKWLIALDRRFKKRKQRLLDIALKRLLSSECIQRGYRCYVARVVVNHARELARFERIRKNAGLITQNASLIQRNWRQLKSNRFPRHVYLLMIRLELERQRKLFKSAFSIQKIARPYIKRQVDRRFTLHTQCVVVIFRLVKAYLLKLVIFDRVEATRARRLAASIIIKKNLRNLLWWRGLICRFAVRKMEFDYVRLLHVCANIIQKGLMHKVDQFYMPLRVAGRYLLLLILSFVCIS